jgi:hypothetical protein
MTKVKYDVTNSDPERAASGGGASVNPGRYHGRISTVVLKKGRDPDSGQPSKDHPLLDITTKILEADSKKNKKMKGRDIRDFPLLPEHPSYDGMEWKLDRWLLASGIATKKKRKGSFDTDDMVDSDVIIVVRPQRNDPQRTEIGSVVAYDEEEWESSSSDDDEDDDISDDDLEGIEDEDEDEDEDEEDYSEWTADDLREELDEREIEYKKTAKKPTLIKLLEADDESDEDEDEDEDEDDDQELDYSDRSLDELKEELDERDIDYSSKVTKKKAIALLEEDDEGDEDDEDEDEEEDEPEPPKKKAKGKTSKSTKSKKSKKGKKSDDDDEDFPFK